MSAEARGEYCRSSSSALFLMHLRQDLLLNHWGRLAGQQELLTVLYPVSINRVTGMHSHAQLLHGCWGFELRSLSLTSRHSYPWRHVCTSCEVLLSSKHRKNSFLLKMRLSGSQTFSKI